MFKNKTINVPVRVLPVQTVHSNWNDFFKRNKTCNYVFDFNIFIKQCENKAVLLVSQ